MECFRDSEATLAFSQAVSEMLPRALEQAKRLKLMSARGNSGSSGGAPSSSASGTDNVANIISSAFMAVQQLWPLGQRSLLMRVFDGLEGYPGGVEQFALMCDRAMQTLPEIATALHDASGRNGKVPGTVLQDDQRVAAADVEGCTS